MANSSPTRYYFILVTAFFVLSIACTTLAAASYTVRDLGTTGRVSIPAAINDQGQAAFWLVGEEMDADLFAMPQESIFFDGSATAALPSLGGYLNGVSDINNSAVIVGYSNSPATPPLSSLARAVRFVGGQIEDLGVTPNNQSTASAVNDLGQIVGAGRFESGYHAFLWNSPGDIVVLGSLGGAVSNALDINNSGIVVGSSQLAPTPDGLISSVAFVYKDGLMTGLDVFGSLNSSASAINDRGQIVGAFETDDGESHPFLFDSLSGLRDLGASGLDSSAYDINEQGVILGHSERVADSGVQYAFLYDAVNGTRFLEDLIGPNTGWSNLTAHSINNRGQILGQGIINGESHVFLATPTPEPATLALSAIATLWHSLLRRRRQKPFRPEPLPLAPRPLLLIMAV
jgi:probable HAF family extracellular repeat protein